MAVSSRLLEPIETDRLVLSPLRVGDAEEMVAVLSSPRLYEFTGGTPPTLAALQSRYTAWAAGHSPDHREEWLNWIVRLRDRDRTAVGTTQATVIEAEGRADVAWVIAAEQQGRGYATEAAVATVRALVETGVPWVTAHVHPDHAASAAVARACGLTPTEELHDGERRWEWRSGHRHAQAARRFVWPPTQATL